MRGTGVTFKVKTETLRQKSSSINGKINNIKNKFDDMERIVKNTRTYWEGEASDINREVYSEYKDEILEIIARLEEHVTDLESMAGVYETTEQDVKNLIDELPNDVIV